LEVEEDVEDYDNGEKEGKKNNSVWYFVRLLKRRNYIFLLQMCW